MVVALQATDLAVGYRTPVVEHISLALHTGEVMALIGPNGSGKSTLLKTLARRLKPISGSIALFGQDIASLPPTRLA